MKGSKSMYMISIAMESAKLSISITKDCLMARMVRSVSRLVNRVRDGTGRLRNRANDTCHYGWHVWQQKDE